MGKLGNNPNRNHALITCATVSYIISPRRNR